MKQYSERVVSMAGEDMQIYKEIQYVDMFTQRKNRNGRLGITEI